MLLSELKKKPVIPVEEELVAELLSALKDLQSQCRKSAPAIDRCRARSVIAKVEVWMREQERIRNHEFGLISLERATELLVAAEFVFAKTMPQNPHWYTLRRKWANDLDFIEVVHFIRKNGIIEYWPPPPAKGAKYTVMVIDGFKYWTMGCPCRPGPYDPRVDTILINRKPEPQ